MPARKECAFANFIRYVLNMVDFLLVFYYDSWTVCDTPGFGDI